MIFNEFFSRSKFGSIISLVGLLSAGQSFSQTAPEAPSAVTFTYNKSATNVLTLRQTKTYSWGTQTLPNAPATTADDNTLGNFQHTINKTDKPANTTTQYITFKFRSNGFFATAGHFAVIGKSNSGATFNRGRGFIIGKNKSPTAPTGCAAYGPGAWVQPETWWTKFTNATSYVDAGQTVWVGTSQTQSNWVGDGSYCGQANLQDNTTYDVVVHTNNGGVAYWVYPNGSSTSIVSMYFTDTYNKESAIVDASTGYSFAAVFGGIREIPTPPYTGPVPAPTNWSIQLTNITTGWF